MAVLIPASHMHPHSFPTRRSSDLSLGLYTKDAFVPATWPANQWSLRIDAARIVPVLERLGDNRGLRIAAGRLHRRSEEHTSELQSQSNLVCRLPLEKKKHGSSSKR